MMYRYSVIILCNILLLADCHLGRFSEITGSPQMSPIGSSLNQHRRILLSGIDFKNPRATKKVIPYGEILILLFLKILALSM